MKYLYIFKVGTTFPTTKEKLDDFDTWVMKSLKTNRIKVIDVQNSKTFPKITSAKGFIITGSHSMVTEELPWSVKLEAYIQRISKTNIPLLGICYGHQLINKALGGKSGFNKKGKEIGTVRVKKLCNDPILKNIPQNFCAFETHYQTAIKLPRGAKVLAKNKKDNHQAVRFTNNIWGVQFHPEFDKDIMKEYILNQKTELVKLGFSMDILLQNIRKCDLSSRVLVNFSKLFF